MTDGRPQKRSIDPDAVYSREEAAEALGHEQARAAAVEQTLKGVGRTGDDRRHAGGAGTGDCVLAAGKQAQRERAPDAA